MSRLTQQSLENGSLRFDLYRCVIDEACQSQRVTAHARPHLLSHRTECSPCLGTLFGGEALPSSSSTGEKGVWEGEKHILILVRLPLASCSDGNVPQNHG